MTRFSAAPFYASRRGHVAAGALRPCLARLWPDLAGQSVLGLGYVAPFLDVWRPDAYRVVAATLPCHGRPAEGCLVQEGQLPLPDLGFDRVLLVHGLDLAADGARLLREVWRVLKDDGRLIVVVPNRMGLWAGAERTPFGTGRPYSARQAEEQLRQASFATERRVPALFVPPTPWLLHWPGLWERVGRAVAPELAGVFVFEAVKDAYAALPVTAPARRMVILPEAA